ncbi:tRNA/rRNA methyltransferase [Oceanimonas baumannii]|uniref:tRNA (cytidine/uridine-2'-O-)-methyltransferase TrmJ n=1 Tax=Oceanimonas baumannii TaxID=129578 RepID=A0A235CQF4_9GAMM|nr:tRNA/rRNA methyltransferase [Oceanimonas baumannii]TDW62261.1 tRNA/rRNA methyltransferase [Oceanimonas baumannii]
MSVELYFFLESPARPENVGAAARAMKTMGFERMRIINSRVHEQEQAQWVAHGAQELLEQAEYFPTLADGLADMDLVIATTARRRGRYQHYLTPREAVAQVNNKAVQRVAILFGCEESGLSNEHLSQADIISYLPLKVSYPSLNLGQAIMLYAWELSQGLAPEDEQKNNVQQGNAQLRVLQHKTEQLMDSIGVSQQEKLAEWVKDRLPVLGQRDLNLLHLLYKDLERALKSRG